LTGIKVEDTKLGQPQAISPDYSSVPSNEVVEWWSTSNEKEEKHIPETMADSKSDGNSGTLQMFWTDAVEIRDRPGKLYLIGKV